jgi:hypothetical protein
LDVSRQECRCQVLRNMVHGLVSSERAQTLAKINRHLVKMLTVCVACTVDG